MNQMTEPHSPEKRIFREEADERHLHCGLRMGVKGHVIDLAGPGTLYREKRFRPGREPSNTHFVVERESSRFQYIKSISHPPIKPIHGDFFWALENTQVPISWLLYCGTQTLQSIHDEDFLDKIKRLREDDVPLGRVKLPFALQLTSSRRNYRGGSTRQYDESFIKEVIDILSPLGFSDMEHLIWGCGSKGYSNMRSLILIFGNSDYGKYVKPKELRETNSYSYKILGEAHKSGKIRAKDIERQFQKSSVPKTMASIYLSKMNSRGTLKRISRGVYVATKKPTSYTGKAYIEA